MSAPATPSDDEVRAAIAEAVSDPAVIEMFLAALQADENDEAVYGWMVEESEDSNGKASDCLCIDTNKGCIR